MYEPILSDYRPCANVVCIVRAGFRLKALCDNAEDARGGRTPGYGWHRRGYDRLGSVSNPGKCAGVDGTGGGEGYADTMLRIRVAGVTFTARFEEAAAPRTVAAFRELLPYTERLIQARWSGESGWIPLGDFQLGVGIENATSYPSPGEILFYPGGFSETEILFPYGRTCFASTMGQLAGNHFLTIVEGNEQLKEVGRRIVWEGAQEIVFEDADPGTA